MNDVDRDAYCQRYRERLAQFGYDPRTLGWMSGRQHERFQAITSFCPWDVISSVLDVGCGFGDLFAFLRDRGFRGKYTGIDIVPELIAEGSQVHPDADLRIADISDWDVDQKFDLVAASGIFNAKLIGEENWPYICSTAQRMFSLCKVAAAFDFLSSYVDYEDARLNYTSPERIFTFAKSLTRRVALAHDYLPFEFAICLFTDDRIAERSRFFPLVSPD